MITVTSVTAKYIGYVGSNIDVFTDRQKASRNELMNKQIHTEDINTSATRTHYQQDGMAASTPRQRVGCIARARNRDGSAAIAALG